MHRNTSDAVDSWSKMSKAEVLRGFVTERLAAVSQEIFVAVDRIVAGYEEEASGFRQEIDRQRRQLEALLQSQVTLGKAGGKRRRSLHHVEEDEGEDEEDEYPDHLKNPQDLGQFEKRKSIKAQNHVVLRIRILKGSQTKVLSKNVLRTCPVVKLKCPRGLQESDFLDLLRATCPQLAGDDKPFDVLTSNKRRRLQHLKLKTVTPEEIHRNVGLTGSGALTLFIRLKAQKEPQVSEKDSHPLQKEDIGAEGSQSTSATLACDETMTQTRTPVQEVQGSRVEVPSSSSTSPEMETAEAGEEDHGISGPAEGTVAHSAAGSNKDGSIDDEKEEEKEEANDSDDDWKPDRDEKTRESNSELQSKKQKTTEAKAKNSDAVLSCKVCGVLHKLEVTLAQHAWSHVDNPGSLCGVCGELPESMEALKDNLQSHHKTNDCHICGETFLSALGLREHVAAHSGEKPFECDVCHDAFALKVSLNDHMKLHEASKPQKCYTCHKVFALKEELQAHHVTHTNKKMHLCGVCGKSLSDFRSLSRHKMTHTGERPHACQICGQRFKLIGTLRQHEKIHTDRERSYLCDVCCKMFLTSHQLQIHMRTHTKEKPYHCGECGKGFSTKGPLTIHMRVHTGETPYRCPDCGWSFKRKIHLDNHITIHSGVKPFVCGVCGKACARKAYLIVHMRTHSGERPYKCSVCDKGFTQSHCLKTHMKSHLAGETTT